MTCVWSNFPGSQGRNWVILEIFLFLLANYILAVVRFWDRCRSLCVVVGSLCVVVGSLWVVVARSMF
jgi:hypothetical protein